MPQVDNTNTTAATTTSPPTQQLEHNKKWRSYLLICVTSLTNFVSIRETSNVDLPENSFLRNSRTNYSFFGMVTFTASLLILIFDLIGIIRNKFDLKSIKDGKLEGWILFSFLLWWICGVISITNAGSIGYAALNIYFSAWASLFACLDALNRWGGEKDVLTLRELTGISITLPSWWVVFWASVVTLGSAADAGRLAQTDYVRGSCAVAIGVGIITTLVSAFFILSHYEFLQCCHACTAWLSYGGWFELACSVLVNIWLVIGLEQLTGAGKIASTITGNGSSDPTSEAYVPGSNIYVAIWTAFIASARVTVKWKEARAIRFAQTSGGKAGEGGGDDSRDDADTEIGNGNGDNDDDSDI